MDIQKVTSFLENRTPEGEKKVMQSGVTAEKNLETLSKETVSSPQDVRQLSEEKLNHLVRRMNTVMEALSIEARFSIHQPTREIVVTLVNRDTGEVVRQIPPEKLLDMVARLRELAGLFVDEVV